MFLNQNINKIKRQPLVHIKPVLRVIMPLFLLFIGPLTQIYAISYRGIGGKPAYPRVDNPRTKSIFIYTLEPNEIINDAVIIQNGTPEIKTVTIDTVDSIPSSGGGFACKQVSDKQTGVGSWMELETNVLTLNPNSEKTVKFTVQVPDNPDTGEHNGCIVIQEQDARDENESGINILFRTGMRVAITIPGELKKELEIVDYKVERLENGRFNLQPVLKNIGNVSIDTELELTTTNFFGKEFQKHGGEFTILRDDTAEWNFELKEPFWGGWFKTCFTAEYDESPNTEIGKKDLDNLKKLKSKTVTFFTPPSTYGLLAETAIVVSVFATGLNLWLLLKRKKWIKDSWMNYNVKSSDNIKKIAKAHKVSWRLLARVNKIKSPYILNSGETIKVPPKT